MENFNQKYRLFHIHMDKNAHCEAVVNGIHMSVCIHLLSAYLFDVSITLCVRLHTREQQSFYGNQ